MLLRFGLTLLLSAPLAAGCSDDGFIGQTSSAASDPSTSSTNTTGPADTSEGGSAPPMTTASTSDDDDTRGPSSESTTGTTGPQDTTTGTTEATTNDTEATTRATDSGSSTGGPNEACANGCAVEFMCGSEWATEEECVLWCEANLAKADAFSPFCRDAWEAVSACLGTLTCEEFMVWENPDVFPYPCSDADTSLSIECKGQ